VIKRWAITIHLKLVNPFKARHGKNIAKGKTSAAYWADKFFWAGSKGSKKSPPKGQKLVRGIKRK
jgi:hypothetical protein